MELKVNQVYEITEQSTSLLNKGSKVKIVVGNDGKLIYGRMNQTSVMVCPISTTGAGVFIPIEHLKAVA